MRVSRNRAYLEHEDHLTISGKPLTTVYWTDLDSLPVELSKKLKNGESSWSPPLEK